jgi:signal transduction histidine kinase
MPLSASREGTFVEKPAPELLHGSSAPIATEARDHQAQRALIVGQLAGGILHDFNNVLTVITATIDILAKAVSDRPELVAITNLIDDAAIRGAKLTSHLLAFARGRPSEPGDVDINALVKDASRLLRATLGVDIETDLVLAIDPPRAWADRGQLMAAILSLAIMARDALPAGGALTFRTRAVQGEPSSAASCARQCEAVVITVQARSSHAVEEHRGGLFHDAGSIEHFVSGFGGYIKADQSGDEALAEIFLPIG